MEIEACSSCDKDWVEAFILERWGAKMVVVHGTIYYPAEMPGFIAREGEKPSGLLTYRIEGSECEIVTLDSLYPCQGIGTALITAVKQIADSVGSQRLWLVTTNDNLDALRFYQRRGFQMVAVHPGAVTAARLTKPEIPLIGNYGIPLRDEIELEMVLTI